MDLLQLSILADEIKKNILLDLTSWFLFFYFLLFSTMSCWKVSVLAK